MKPDVVNNEREGMDQCEDEKGVCGPSMKHLQLLVWYSGKQSNPVRLACCGAESDISASQRLKNSETYKTKGIHAKAIHPDLVAKGGEPPQSKLGQ